jgi:hypothetical protein
MSCKGILSMTSAILRFLIPWALMLSAPACARQRVSLPSQPGGEPASAAVMNKSEATRLPPQTQAPMPCRPAETAAELHRRMRAEAGDAFVAHKTTPLLVDRWPAPTRVLVFTYQSRGLPTGVVAYQISTPAWKLTVSPRGAKVEATPLPSPKVLGKERRGAIDDDLQTRITEAEGALMRAVAGCRPVATCDELAPYQAWADAHRLLARHLAALPGVVIPCAKTD